MANFYDDDIAATIEMIAEFGTDATWNSVGRSEEPADPWNGNSVTTTTAHSVKICFLPNDSKSDALLMALKGDVVRSGSMYGLMGQVDFEPDENDNVTWIKGDLSVKAIDVLQPNGVPILYTIWFET